MLRLPSGTRCSRFAFVRAAGTVQSRLATLISAQRAEHFACARRCQDQKLEGQSAALACLGSSQVRDKTRNTRIWQCRVVLVAVTLLRHTLGNSFNRVFAAAVAGGLRPSEHRADALSDTSSRLWLGEPDWREHAQHGGGVDLIDAARAELREGVLLKGVAPLLGVLFVRPRGFVLAVDALDGLGEGRHNVLRFAALGQRVASLSCGLTIGQCPFMSFGQRDEASSTQADIAAATLHDEAQEPAFRTGRIDDEVETVPIGIAAGLFKLAHLHRGECLFRMPAPSLHRSSAELACPTFLTTQRLGCSQIQPDRLGR
ncbi:hypothetical protein ASF33_13855 [Methylobacterium sp. Leaf92]|nr:hypothetical protein ASF33_13855 [Methylobacterium sp. Leaf92]